MIHRRANASPIIVILLAGILLALIGLVVAVWMNGPKQKGQGGIAIPAPKGGTITRKDLAHPRATPKKPVNNPDRIKETLRPGKTYQIVLKAGFEARVEDKDWGVRQVTTLIYEGEMLVNRTIESNDGKRVVELRHFEKCRTAKLLCNVEGVSIELGPFGVLALSALDYLQPGTSETAVTAKPIVEALLQKAVQSSVNEESVKAFARVDGLNDKRVRMTYVDGVGVESIEAVDCTLTNDERDFLFGTAVLSDCYILPDLSIKQGQTWTVDGGQLGGFLDPSWRGIPEGDIVVVREADQTVDGKQFAGLSIQKGFIRINASDNAARRVGTFEPHGDLKYSTDEGYITSAALDGKATIERVSRDHILFEASFQTQPTMKVSYSCKMLP